jgi:LCP family protein required for cell wall assembly
VGQVASRSASLAALLSFFWPGLGQLYLGRPRAAAAFAVPIVVVFLFALLQVRDGLDVLVVRLFAPSATAVAVVLLLATAAWRLASMADAFLSARGYVIDSMSQARRMGRTWREGKAKRTFAILIALVVLSHGLLIGAALAIGGTGSRIFYGGNSSAASPNPGSEPQLPQETPYVTPKADGWINILLVGADSGMGYDHSLTDTMIVLSVNQVTEDAAMFSFPRDIARFPMYSGGTYGGKLNSLMSTAAAHPDEYPDGALGTLSRELGFLLGVPIHYYAFVNLAGFKTMIDEVGGIDIVNDRAIDDRGYQFPDGVIGFHLSAGQHHLDGRTALAYVRSRNGPGDNDFTRARRQQQLLLALRDKLVDPSMLPRFPAVLDAAASILQTNYPVEQAADLLSLAKRVAGDGVERFVLGPPYAERPAAPTSTYMLILEMQILTDLSIRIFGEASAYAE